MPDEVSAQSRRQKCPLCGDVENFDGEWCRECGHVEGPTVLIQPGGSDRPVYAALDCPAWVAGKEVVLAVEKNEDPTQRKVIAMFPDEARYLRTQGRLLGWEPSA